jgi:hypothetical protein
MAIFWPIANGNWSTLSNWASSDGVTSGSPSIRFPNQNDDVYANNNRIYVDVSTRVLSVRNVTINSFNSSNLNWRILLGGFFIINNGISLSANVEGGGVTGISNACVQFLSAFPSSGNLFGNLSCNNTNILYPAAFNLSGSGSFNIYGNALGAFNNNSTTTISNGYIVNNSSGTLEIIGNIQGPLNGSRYYAVNNASTGTVNITGNITGGIGNASGSQNPAVVNSFTGFVNTSGNFIFAGTGSTIGGNGVANEYSSTITSIAAIMSGGTGVGTGAIVNVSNGSFIAYGDVYGGVPTGTSEAVGASNLHTGTLIIFGNVFGSQRTSGFSGGGSGIINSGLGTTIINGNVFGGREGNQIRGIRNSNLGEVIINGNVFGGPTSLSVGIRNESLGKITINGFISGGNVSSNAVDNIGSGSIILNGDAYGGNANGANGILNSSTGTVIINGIAIGGDGSSAHGASNTGAGSIFARRVIANGFGIGSTGPINGSSVGLNNTSIYGICFVEEMRSGNRGLFPTAGNVYISNKITNNASFFSLLSSDSPNLSSLFLPFPNASWIRAISADPNYSSALSGITGFNFLYSGLSGDSTLVPTVSNVRRNVVYNFSNNTGIVYIPNPFTVRSGVSSDNGFGLGVFDPSLVWIAPLTGFENITNSIGQRVFNSTSIESVGNFITDLN